MIFSRLLYGVHDLISSLDHLVYILGRHQKSDSSDTERYGPTMLAHALTQYGQQLLQNLLCSTPAGVRQHQCELVASQPCHEVRIPDTFLHYLSDCNKHLVPGRVSVAIIDLFEGIEIDIGQCHRRIGPPGPAHLCCCELVEGDSRTHFGQIVNPSQFSLSYVERLQVGDQKCQQREEHEPNQPIPISDATIHCMDGGIQAIRGNDRSAGERC